MTPETIAIVKSTAPLLKERGLEIVLRMYEIAFEQRPDLRRFFGNSWMQNPEAGMVQAKRLAASVHAYASHIDDLGQLSQAVEHIAKSHVRSKIVAEMYPLIGGCLLTAMKDILGEAATADVLQAWEEAYNALADILIKREGEMYREQDGELFDVGASRSA